MSFILAGRSRTEKMIVRLQPRAPIYETVAFPCGSNVSRLVTSAKKKSKLLLVIFGTTEVFAKRSSFFGGVDGRLYSFVS